MIVACHCEGRGWNFWGDSNLKGKFWGRSIQLDPVGILTLQFEDGETFQWSKVTTSIYNIIIGKIYCDHYGTMRIKGSGQYSCKLKFKEQSIIDRNPHQASTLYLIYYLLTIIVCSMYSCCFFIFCLCMYMY
jgi:oxysterol-binding protein 1